MHNCFGSKKIHNTYRRLKQKRITFTKAKELITKYKLEMVAAQPE